EACSSAAQFAAAKNRFPTRSSVMTANLPRSSRETVDCRRDADPPARRGLRGRARVTDQPVDLGPIVSRELPGGGGGGVGADLLGGGGAGDHAGHDRGDRQPRQRQLVERVPVRGGEPGETLDDVETLV